MTLLPACDAMSRMDLMSPFDLQYIKMSSRRLEKFGEILTSPEVIRAQTLHFKPNFKFSRLKFKGGGPTTPFGVCASKLWSVSSVCKNLRGQHPLRAEI